MNLENAIVKAVLGTVGIIAVSTVICKAADTVIALKAPKAPEPVRVENNKKD